MNRPLFDLQTSLDSTGVALLLSFSRGSGGIALEVRSSARETVHLIKGKVFSLLPRLLLLLCIFFSTFRLCVGGGWRGRRVEGEREGEEKRSRERGGRVERRKGESEIV